MSLADDLNRALADCRELPHDPLAGAYESEFRRLGRETADAFLVLVADATWSPPTVEQVTNWSVSMARIRGAQRRMMGAILGRMNDVPGIDFNLTQPVVQRLLNQLAVRADSLIRDGVRTTAAHAIARGWAEGRSVPQTAALIRTMVGDVAGWKATALARTDLIGLSNGAGQSAVTKLNDSAKKNNEPKPIQTKTWLNAGDSRVRETHQEAEGQTVPVDQPYRVGGQSLAYPGDPFGPSEEVMNCRCTEIFNEAPNAAPPPPDPPVGLRAATAAGYRQAAAVPCSASDEEERMSVAEADPTTAEAPLGSPWHSDVAFEGVPTGDGRIMMPGSLGWRDTPLTLMAMIETTEGGHLGAQVSGRMDTFEKRGSDMDGKKLPAGTTAVYSTGVFDVGEYGSEIERMVDTGTLRGISVDLSIAEWAFYDPETEETIDPAEATDEQWERAFLGELDFAVLDGTILAATVCPTPAFADARIALAASGWVQGRRNVWRAGREYALAHGIPEDTLMTTLVASFEPRPLTASVFERAPILPPRSAFEVPEADGPQPIQLRDGILTGHLCLWETCHTGFLSGQFSECIKPSRSFIDYADFHLGGLPLDDGEALAVGRLTVGTGHADPYGDRLSARAHYDNTGTVVAFVRAVDGRHGVWLSGVVKSDATDEQIRDLLACPLSGDWRSYNGNLELQAALAVVAPGFPVAAKAQLALSASGAPMTLILPSNVGPALDAADVVPWSADVLHAAIDGTLDEIIQSDDCGCV